uniref:Uncharacterized protein n=1 Tax=Salix viminalis TaxID=40686 RepID=A0A6N2M6C1_SALVM
MTFFHPTSSDMWRKKPRNSASPILPLDSSTVLAEEHENGINWAITVTKKKWVDPVLICHLKARLYWYCIPPSFPLRILLFFKYAILY